MSGSLITQATVILGEITSESTTPCGCDPNLCHGFKLRQRFGDNRRPRKISARYRRGYQNALRGLYQRLARHSTKTATVALDDIPGRYTGSQKALYTRAVEVVKNQVMRSSGVCSVKWGERCKDDTSEKRGRSRVIIPQYQRCEATGQYLPGPIAVELPIRLVVEQALHSLRNPDGSRQCASARSLTQRAGDIKKMFRQGWRCVSIDATSFDGSLGDLAVDEREECYKFAQRRGDATENLRRVLQQQNSLPLRTKTGARGVLKKNRASGTGGTSSGNKVVMLAALIASCGRSYESGDVLFYCDGDDTLIFVSPAIVATFDDPDNKHGPCPLFRSWLRRMDQLGLEIVVENIAASASEVVFCRSKIVETINGPQMVKIPSHAFITQACIVRHFKGPQFADYLATLREGFANMWAGVPVLGKLGNMFPAGRSNEKLLSTNGIERWVRNSHGKHSKTVTLMARRSFEQTFGYTPDEQIALEKIFDRIGVEMEVALPSFVVSKNPLPLPVRTW